MPEQKTIIEEFRNRYYDKNSVSGLNQRLFKGYPALVKDIEQFILYTIEQEKETIIRLLKETLERGYDVDNLKGSIENIIKLYGSS